MCPVVLTTYKNLLEPSIAAPFKLSLAVDSGRPEIVVNTPFLKKKLG